MKQKSFYSILYLLGISILVCSFDGVNQINSVNANYTLRALVNSSSVSVMVVTESGGNATVTTTNTTPSTGDDYFCYLYSDISYSSGTYAIPANTKYWLVPFDGSIPIQLGAVAAICYESHCPCHSNPDCTNQCEITEDGFTADGMRIIKCSKTVGGEDEPCKGPDYCQPKNCKINCSTGAVLSSIFVGPYFVVKANSLTYNGTLYN